jgi:hypothetical protein
LMVSEKVLPGVWWCVLQEKIWDSLHTPTALLPFLFLSIPVYRF